MSDVSYRDCPRCKRSTVETLEWVGRRIPARCSACGATWPDLGFYYCEVEDALGLRKLGEHLKELRDG